MWTVDDFDYDLPGDLIAQHPNAERSASRLLQISNGRLEDRLFRELPALLQPGDLLVLNDTRVIRARLQGRKESGGRVEVLIERLLDDRRALAQVRASKPPRAGSRLVLEGAMTMTVCGRQGVENALFLLEVVGAQNLEHLLAAHGRLPLPPYIQHTANADDEARYQTVFARCPGAVAAPTAGLHFDEPLFSDLGSRSVELAWLTLHVGAGTFQPVRVRHLAEHRMHAERYNLPEHTVDAIHRTHARSGKVVAVGTTTLRTLEAAAQGGELRFGGGETDLFITPGFPFRVVDRLITNFHLPRSTLLMLVSAFAGVDTMRTAYHHAIAHRYRFFSYGDAMLIDRS